MSLFNGYDIRFGKKLILRNRLNLKSSLIECQIDFFKLIIDDIFSICFEKFLIKVDKHFPYETIPSHFDLERSGKE